MSGKHRSDDPTDTNPIKGLFRRTERGHAGGWTEPDPIPEHTLDPIPQEEGPELDEAVDDMIRANQVAPDSIPVRNVEDMIRARFEKHAHPALADAIEREREAREKEAGPYLWGGSHEHPPEDPDDGDPFGPREEWPEEYQGDPLNRGLVTRIGAPPAREDPPWPNTDPRNGKARGGLALGVCVAVAGALAVGGAFGYAYASSASQGLSEPRSAAVTVTATPTVAELPDDVPTVRVTRWRTAPPEVVRVTPAPLPAPTVTIRVTRTAKPEPAPTVTVRRTIRPEPKPAETVTVLVTPTP